MPITILLWSSFFVAAYWLREQTRLFLIAHQLTALNYEGHQIPLGFGIYLWALTLYFGFIQSVSWKFTPFIEWDNRHLLLVLILFSVVFFLGWLDDTVGPAYPKGLYGHLKKWLTERVWTTGLLKAVGISIVAAWAVLPSSAPWWIIIMQIVLLAAFSNTLNLLDVRPGRALKGFLAAAIPLFAIAWIMGGPFHQGWVPLFPLMIGSLALLSLDLKGQGMLGDAGANLLGFALGYASVIILPYWVQAVLSVGLLWLHGYAETHSLSSYIDQSRWLRKLDRWGQA